MSRSSPNAAPDHDLAVTVDSVDGLRCRLSVSGTLDLCTAERLSAELDAQRAAGRRFLRMDLSRVTFIDATALGVIVAAHHLFLADRGTLIITGPSTCVTRLLNLTGLATALFTIAAVPEASAWPVSRRLAAVPRAG